MNSVVHLTCVDDGVCDAVRLMVGVCDGELYEHTGAGTTIQEAAAALDPVERAMSPCGAAYVHAPEDVPEKRVMYMPLTPGVLLRLRSDTVPGAELRPSTMIQDTLSRFPASATTPMRKLPSALEIPCMIPM